MLAIALSTVGVIEGGLLAMGGVVLFFVLVKYP
jgi:hypothetical protein